MTRFQRQTGASSRPSWDRQQPDLHHVLQTRAPGICATQSVQIHSDHLLLADMKSDAVMLHNQHNTTVSKPQPLCSK